VKSKNSNFEEEKIDVFIIFFSLCYPMGFLQKFSQFGPAVRPAVANMYLYILAEVPGDACGIF